MLSEQEEFEFRLRLEREQAAAQSQGQPADILAQHQANVAAEAEAYQPGWTEAYKTGGLFGAGGVGDELVRDIGPAITEAPGRIGSMIAGAPQMLWQGITKPAALGVEMVKGATEPLISPRATGKAVMAGAVDTMALAGAAKGLGAAARAIPKSSEALRESAIKQYSKVLGPTTKENKLLTERVVPELLKRKVRAGSRAGLERRAATEAAAAGEALESAYANLPQEAIVQYGPILKRIEDAKSKLVVEGTGEVVQTDLYKALEKVRSKVERIAESSGAETPQASVATTRSARQQFDKAVAAKTKIFGRTGKETAKLAAEKEAGNAIRNQLAKEYPDIAAINEEVSLWLKVKDIIEETNVRTASQATPLGERVMTAAGVGAGLARGGLGTALGYATGLKALSKLVNSTAWRTVSAVEKNRLADLLASGKVAAAEAQAAKLAGRSGAAIQIETKRSPVATPPIFEPPRVTVDDILDIIKKREAAQLED